MKIRFTESRWLDTEDRTKVPKFKEGSTHDLSEASAHRWTRRGYAVYVVEEAKPMLKVGRPMMGFDSPEIAKVFSVAVPDVEKESVPEADEFVKPKKVGRPKKRA